MIGVVMNCYPRWPLPKQMSLSHEVEEGARRIIVGSANSHRDAMSGFEYVCRGHDIDVEAVDMFRRQRLISAKCVMGLPRL
jgi:hypothetical protein